MTFTFEEHLGSLLILSTMELAGWAQTPCDFEGLEWRLESRILAIAVTQVEYYLYLECCIWRQVRPRSALCLCMFLGFVFYNEFSSGSVAK